MRNSNFTIENLDEWKLQTPPEFNDEPEKERCKACLEKFNLEELVTLDLTWYKLTPHSLVCDECKKLIEKELGL